MKIFRPLWNEGALLSPQQFQQQSAWEAFTNAGVLGLSSPFPWGVERVELDDELLASGRIQVMENRCTRPAAPRWKAYAKRLHRRAMTMPA